jgi:hypothetical protein
MGKCVRCDGVAKLYENGTPRCLKCSEAIEEARKQTASAIIAQRERPISASAMAT